MTKNETDVDERWRSQPVAVMVSGGPDSAVLLGEIAQRSPRVVPIYVRFGLIWEDAEERVIREFIRLLYRPNVERLRVHELPIRNVYGDHWSTTGECVPDHNSPDNAVLLPGRNLLILVQAAVWCQLNGVPTMALGLLRGNPFPDAGDDFFESFEKTVSSGLSAKVRIVRPYSHLSKSEVLQRGKDFPLQATWSCMSSLRDQHCGQCNKCAERQRAFEQAGVGDPTEYAQRNNNFS